MMPSCLDTYRQAVEDAHDTFETALGTCTTLQCKRNAIEAYRSAVDDAYQQFLECQGNPGGPVTVHHTGIENAYGVYGDSPKEQEDVDTFTESAETLLEGLVEA